MTTNRSGWLVPAGLILLGLVPAVAGTARLIELGDVSAMTEQNARFFESPLPIILHIPAVIVFSIVGAFQFSAGIRQRHNKWHRVAGRVLIPLGFLAALTGLWMTQFYPWPPTDGRILYVERLVVGFGMLAALALAVRALHARNYTTHGEWMTRAYAIGLGAGTQVFTHLPWFILVGGMPGGVPRAVMMGGGWLINVIAAEWIIYRRRLRQVGRRVPISTDFPVFPLAGAR